jgi:type IV pilus assembly protein PilB
MATPPNDNPVPPKKPTPPSKPAPPGVKPPAPGARPPLQGPKPPIGAKPDVKKPGPPKPPPTKPSGTKPPSAKGPGPKSSPKGGGESRAGRKLGQVLVDLGFVDDEQLWEILDEAKNSGLPTGQVAVSRGLITDEQLLTAMAEQHGLKVVNLEEFKPQAEAITLVPETMATVYKVLPLTFRDKVLTIALSDPSNMAAVDDLRNLLGISEVKASLAPAKAVLEAMTKAYAGKEESIVDINQQ